jgi:hypothetical protein
MFFIQNSLKQGDALSALHFNLALKYAINKAKELKWKRNIYFWT